MTEYSTPVRPANNSVALIRNWPLTLFAWLLLPVLVSLGFWQLRRAEEKTVISASIDSRLSAQPQDPAELERLQIYTPVRLLGHYQEEILYLDNRTRKGRVGYEVLQVFLSGNQRWLVNRGWVAGGTDRSQLPEVQWPSVVTVITGFLYPVSEKGNAAERGARIQQVDRALTSHLKLAQAGWSIRLSADSATALVTDWQLISSPAQRHTAYALQWFTMAVVLLLMWLSAATNLPHRLYKNQKRSRSDKP